jgi:hypothetical protein
MSSVFSSFFKFGMRIDKTRNLKSGTEEVISGNLTGIFKKL